MGSYGGLVLVVILSVFLNCVSCESEIKDGQSKVYIAFVDGSKKPAEYSDAGEWYSAIVKSLKGTSDVIYVYKIFNGFAAKLNKEQVQELRARPEILMLIPDRLYHYDIPGRPSYPVLHPPSPSIS